MLLKNNYLQVKAMFITIVASRTVTNLMERSGQFFEHSVLLQQYLYISVP